MRINAKIYVTGAALLAVAAFAAQDGYKIEWKPEIGKSVKHKVEVAANIDAGGQSMDMKLSMVETSKVTKIGEGKITRESNVSQMSLMVGGQDMSQMMGDQKMGSTSTYNMNGELLDTKADSDQMSNPRLENSYTFYYPRRKSRSAIPGIGTARAIPRRER